MDLQQLCCPHLSLLANFHRLLHSRHVLVSLEFDVVGEHGIHTEAVAHHVCQHDLCDAACRWHSLQGRRARQLQKVLM